MRAMRLTPRQRFLHGFIEYIHNHVIDDLDYELAKARAADEKKRLAKEKRAEKRRLARAEKR